MDKEKRVAGDYTIIEAIHIGNKEIVIGENMQAKDGHCYMVADYTYNELFERYDNCMISNSYIEIAELFVQRLTQQVEQVNAEQDKMNIPFEVITSDMCYPNIYNESIEGKVVAIKANVLRPEHRHAASQIVYVTGGNGSRANARGNAVFCNYVYSGEHTRFERYDVQGVLKPEHYPKWVAEKLKLLEAKRAEQTPKPKSKEMER
ncbi:MAG: hypothetical protein GX800_11220 [Clostridiaceae bacterium]|nr:hypothetical protein [Clostridiaceae bacterium]